MPSFRLPQLFVAFLLFANMALASRFRFSINEIVVGVTRDISEDDLFLAIATTTGFGTNNKTWTLGEAQKGNTFKWDNLTQEIEVPASASNLSIAIGVLNGKSGDEHTVKGNYIPSKQSTKLQVLTSSQDSCKA